MFDFCRHYQKTDLDYLSGLFEQARSIDYAYFQAATANAIFPTLHKQANMKGAFLPREVSREQLLSSDNPFGGGISSYL